MFRTVLKRIAISGRDYASAQRLRASSSSKFQVKINRHNETFELHEAEVGGRSSGKQKKFEFPFVYLRDNCQVRIISGKDA
jgi:hypothetical protein